MLSRVKTIKASLENGTLRSVLESACEEHDLGLGELTVLSAQIDPYRLDTESGHRDGRWLAEQLAALFDPNEKTHWRGLHYAIVQSGRNIKKPDGTLYENTEEDWTWLTLMPAKAARWLGYVPFDRIKDERNADPVIHHKARVEPRSQLSIGLDIEIPDVEDIEPQAVAVGFVARQAFHFAIFGEKSSLETVLLPVAQKYEADLYLPTGEISDTLIYQIAKDADEDGRPLVMFTVSDCDPSGYQMPVSIARKLQALKNLLFPDLRFEVVPVALIPDQVRAEKLPSKPMKKTEKRADRWFKAFGIYQTEIDALTTPSKRGILTKLVEKAFRPYIDRALSGRVKEAKDKWYEEAQRVIDDNVDARRLEVIRKEAAGKLATMQAEIDRINESLQLSSDDFDLPPIEVPEPEIELDPKRQALVSFRDDWVTASRALIARKSYGK